MAPFRKKTKKANTDDDGMAMEPLFSMVPEPEEVTQAPAAPSKQADGDSEEDSVEPTTIGKSAMSPLAWATATATTTQGDDFKPQGAPQTADAVKEEIVINSKANISMRPMPLDRTILLPRDLWMIMEDPKLMDALEQAGLRPDLLIMLYQRLDTMSTGVVGVDEFIESLSRFKVSVQGLDVAGSKSVARGMYNDSKTMAAGAVCLNESFLDIVCQLRGIVAIGADRNTSEGEANWEESGEDLVKEAEMRILSEQNRRLEAKIKMSLIHVSERVRLAEQSGDTHCNHVVGNLMGDGEYDEDNISIDSVQTGRD